MIMKYLGSTKCHCALRHACLVPSPACAGFQSGPIYLCVIAMKISTLSPWNQLGKCCVLEDLLVARGARVFAGSRHGLPKPSPTTVVHPCGVKLADVGLDVRPLEKDADGAVRERRKLRKVHLCREEEGGAAARRRDTRTGGLSTALQHCSTGRRGHQNDVTQSRVRTHGTVPANCLPWI